jgi:hypothetical protein
VNYCARRTGYFNDPELGERRREVNAVPSGPLPHAYGSRVRTKVDGEWGEWTHPKCSWCGAKAPT